MTEIDQYARDTGARLGWTEPSMSRLRSAAGEMLINLIQAVEDQLPNKVPPLIIEMRPNAGLVEMEFMAVSNEKFGRSVGVFERRDQRLGRK